MLERSQVQQGRAYMIGTDKWHVWMIHKPGSGESVSLSVEPMTNSEAYERLRADKTRAISMQMRKFQKAAELINA